MVNGRFKLKVHHPSGRPHLDQMGSALESVASAEGISWEESYEKLISTCGKLGLMPQDRRTIAAMIEGFGYFRQHSSLAGKKMEEFLEWCDGKFHDGEKLIVNISNSYTSRRFAPIIPVERDGEVRYTLVYPRNELSEVIFEVWIAWKDKADHSEKEYRKRQSKVSKRENHTQENEALHVFNENPNDNLIGDCAVRAVAGVLEISWEEAVRRLAKAQDYKVTVINTEENINALLEKEGFQQFGPITRDGVILTGKGFCDIIHDMFQAGTRIFAYVGNSHVVAILVFDGDYKIVDTWDSTDRRITGYWAKYPKRTKHDRPVREETPAMPPKDDSITSLSEGMRIVHKAFGTGEVVSLKNGIASVEFPGKGVRKMAESWVIANCKSAD
jgi:hypothetical protein